MVEKNERYEIEIVGMTSEGQGVGRVDGFVVFVDGALSGERVLVHIVKRTSSYSIGKLIEVLNPSESRREAFCPVFDRCGGCSLQHMSYEATLVYKTGVVKDALQRIAGLGADEVDRLVSPAMGMEQPFNYRNKAQYPIGKNLKNLKAPNEAIGGFYAKRTHDIIPHDYCGIQDKTSGRVREVVLDFMRRHPKELPAYEEATGKGLIRHLMTRVGFKTGEVMVVIVATAKRLPLSDELVAELKREIPALKSVYINVNPSRTNVILGERCIKIFGDDLIFDKIGDLTFRISPLSFFQVNPAQTEVLYAKALEFASLSGRELVYDLYCGTGTIGLFAAQNASKVIGVESVAEAVDDARANASANGITNAEFHVGLAEELAAKLTAPQGANQGANQGADPDNVVFLDPPRKGCEQSLLDTLVNMSPSRIVYVSCNPATLARDLKFLLANGYKLEAAQPVDMFPWSSHVECVVLMSRVEK